MRARNIYLVGFMACGKSTVARQLGVLLHANVLEMDDEIVRKAKKTIGEIFEQEKESGFRKRERELLLETVKRSGWIVSCGGGVPLLPENRELLKEGGLCIYIKATPQLILERTKGKENRPLLKEIDQVDVIAKMMEQREPFYKEVADLTVESGTGDPKLVAQQIVKKMKEMGYTNV